MGDYAKKMRDLGVAMVGIGSHIPEVLMRIEDLGWDVGFYARCAYNIRRVRPPPGCAAARKSDRRRLTTLAAISDPGRWRQSVAAGATFADGVMPGATTPLRRADPPAPTLGRPAEFSVTATWLFCDARTDQPAAGRRVNGRC